MDRVRRKMAEGSTRSWKSAAQSFQSREGERASNLVEYGIVLVVMLTTIFGLIDFGGLILRSFR
jgi:hypothetical protein